MPSSLTWLLVTVWFGGIAALGPAAAGTQYRGKHTAFGSITTINHQTGVLSLNTGASELLLHFPPQVVQNLKTGDLITVHLGFTTGKGAAPDGHYQGEHTMRGTITDIDHQTGRLQLNTAAGELTLNFLPQATQGLKRDDQITVHLGFTKGTPSGSAPGKERR